MKKELIKATIELQTYLSDTPSFQKAIADYVDTNDGFEEIKALKEVILRQPDLMYAVSILASQGTNKNNDVFLRPTLAKIFKTAKHKFVDYEHDVQGENTKKNPDEYSVIGHIYDSALSTQTTKTQIPDSELVIDKDGVLFKKDSPFRNQKLDVLVAWILYKFEFPELAALVEEELKKGDNGKFGVSMEVLFSDHKFRVGDYDPNENFDFDGNSIGQLEARKGTPMAKVLKTFWETKQSYKGKPVVRILGGEIFFSGMAVTSNRANQRSKNIAVASLKESDKPKITNPIIESLIKAVASKSETFDFETCEIINGEPSCDCLSKSVASEIDNLQKEISNVQEIIVGDSMENSIASQIDEVQKCIGEITMAIKKRKDVSPKEGLHKYGEVEYADPVNKKYPLSSPKKRLAAVRYWGQKKNRDKYSPEDQKKIGGKIRHAYEQDRKKHAKSKADTMFAKNLNLFNDDDLMTHTFAEISEIYHKVSAAYHDYIALASDDNLPLQNDPEGGADSDNDDDMDNIEDLGGPWWDPDDDGDIDVSPIVLEKVIKLLLAPTIQANAEENNTGIEMSIPPLGKENQPRAKQNGPQATGPLSNSTDPINTNNVQVDVASDNSGDLDEDTEIEPEFVAHLLNLINGLSSLNIDMASKAENMGFELHQADLKNKMTDYASHIDNFLTKTKDLLNK